MDKGLTNPHATPILAVDRNRWFLICLVLLVLLVISVLDSITVRDNHTDKDIVWVRVFPNTTWDVNFDDVPNQPEYFQSTIDKVLKDWVVARYSIKPYTITEDYGFAAILMHPHLSKEFTSSDVSSGGFNAYAKVAKTLDCGANCFVHYTDIRDIQHYDKVPSRTLDSTVYRSNIFIDEYDVDPNESKSKKDDFEKNIVDIEWRILTKEEILAKFSEGNKHKDLMEYLRLDPIGIEIVNYEKYADTKAGLNIKK